MTRNKKLGFGIGGVVFLGVIAWLAFGIFGIHTLFVDDVVNEENPFATQVVSTSADETGDASDATDAEAIGASADDMDEATGTDLTEDAGAGDTEMADDAQADEPEAAQSNQAAVPEIQTLASGSIVDHDHSGDGTITVITDGDRRFLRFEEDFAIDNGPDLNVYLVRGADAEGDAGLFDDDFIDLGDLKGNIGAQNYELSADIDLDEYNTVVIWCVRFGVAFNAANLT